MAHRTIVVAPSRRRYWVALAAITLIGLLRALFWVASFPVPDSDEGQHFSYVQSLATGKGVPVTGRDHISQETITLFKYSHVGSARSANLSPSITDPNWGLVREQYEGFQGPLYYMIMVPFYWAGRLFNPLGALYSIRMATVLLSLTAVPLVSLLAKEIFPDRPAVSLVAPAVLVSLELFNAQFSLVTNDGIMVPLGALCLWIFARSWRGLTLKRGAAFGASIALLALSKGSAAALLPALAVGSVAMLARSRPPWRQVLRWVSATIVVAGALLLPWLAFNEHAYGAVSGIKANATLTAPVIGSVPANLTGVRSLLRTTKDTLFTEQSLTGVPEATRYRTLWAVVPGTIVFLGLAAAAIRRRWDAFAKMIWLVGSLVAGYAVLVALVFTQAGGGSNIVGRHLGVLAPMFCILVAYSAVVLLGSGLGSALVLFFLLAGFVVEVPATSWWIRSSYAQSEVTGKLVPVIDQDFNDSLVTTTAVHVTTPCSAQMVAFLFAGAPPPSISVAGTTTSTMRADGMWTVYSVVPPPPAGLLTVTFPRAVGLRANSTLSAGPAPSVGLGTPGSPDTRVYCPVSDPEGYRFHQLFPPEHPFGLSLGMMLAWPIVDEALAATFVGVALFATYRYSGKQRNS